MRQTIFTVIAAIALVLIGLSVGYNQKALDAYEKGFNDGRESMPKMQGKYIKFDGKNDYIKGTEIAWDTLETDTNIVYYIF